MQKLSSISRMAPAKTRKQAKPDEDSSVLNGKIMASK
jgi:hypothetical protein